MNKAVWRALHGSTTCWLLLFLPALLLVWNGCGSSRAVQNLAHLYSPKSTVPKAHIKPLFTSHPDSALIFMGIETGKLLFDEEQPLQLNTMLRIELVKSGKTWVPFDTVNFVAMVTKPDAPLTTCAHTIYLPPDNDYRISAYIVEQTTNLGFKGQTSVWRKMPQNDFDEQNYLITLVKNDQILYQPYCTTGEQLRVQFKQQPYSNLFVEYYATPSTMALPPYVVKSDPFLPVKPDSSFTTSAYINLTREGIYHIKSYPEQAWGMTVLCVNTGFPKLTSAPDLIESLRYITRNEEYAQMLQAKDPKKAIDDFWLTRAGSTNRGKILIKEFYGRVQRANTFFTTFTDGWKTDRGIIYIIYGLPDVVNTYPDSETWVYDTRQNQPKIQFDFIRQNNPFTNHHYRLVRDIMFEQSWQAAVYEWRNGIITNLTE